jgi:hypothetical protein
MQKIDRKDPGGLRVQKPPPGRARSARCRINARSMQDPPRRRRRNGKAELYQLAVDPAVSLQRILLRQPKDKASDALVSLSVILTASVLFPAITAGQILGIVAGCGAVSLLAAFYAAARRMRVGTTAAAAIDRTGRDSWRMPPLALLHRPAMSGARRIGMSALQLYLGVAMILVIIKIVQLALGH